MSHLTDIYVELYKRKEYDKIPICRISKHEYGYLTDKQLYTLELLTDQKTTHVGYGGSARSGKTAIEAFWQTLQCLSFDQVRYGIGREELKRLRTKTMNTYYQLWAFWDMMPDSDYKIDNKDYIITFENGSQISLIETCYMPRDPDFLRFGGLELTGCSVDESNESTKKAIDTLFTRVGWQKNNEYNISRKMLETFNPNKSHVYTRYYQPYRDKTETEKKKFIPALPGDNPHPSVRQWIEDVISMGDQTLIERLINGNFDYDDDPSALVDYDAICDLFTNDHVKPGEKRISADLALQGRDRFIGGHWEGLIAHVDIDKEKSTAREIELDIRNLKTSKGVPNSRIVADSDGVGAYLESYINNIVQFHGNEKAKDTQYANLKSECGFKLAEVIMNREMKVICTKDQEERIKTELSICLKRDKIDSDESKKRLIPKDKMKELLGHSPDYFDFLLMGMIFEVKPSRSKPKVTFSSYHR